MTTPTPETPTPPNSHALRLKLVLEPTTLNGRNWPGVVSAHEIDVRSLDSPNIASTAYDVCSGIVHAVEARLRSVGVERDFAQMLAENRRRTGPLAERRHQPTTEGDPQ